MCLFVGDVQVYDKNENGTMMAGELAHTLQNLGERLTGDEVIILSW